MPDRLKPDHQEAVRRITEIGQRVRERAQALRRSPEWTFRDLPPSFALGHAAAEFHVSWHRPAEGGADALVELWLRDLVRILLERAALDGDENAVEVLNEGGASPPIPEERRRSVAQWVDGALAEITPGRGR